MNIMKKEVQNKQIILITLIAIILSLFSILLSVTRLEVITGASSSYTNVTVSAIVDISISTSSIEFIATNPGKTRNSYNSSEVKGCDTDNHCGFNITNDGTRFINVTIQETESLFGSSNFDATQHFTYNVTMKDVLYDTAYGADGNCSTGYDQGFKGPDDNGQWGEWRAIPHSSEEVAVCYLNHTDNSPDGVDDHRPDIAIVEINITVPTNEATGSKTGTLTFTGISAL